METVLMVVTVIALALGIGMSVLAWRLLRDNRLRSAARAEVLRAMAADDDDQPAPPTRGGARGARRSSQEAPGERFTALDDADWETDLEPVRRKPEPTPVERAYDLLSDDTLFAASVPPPAAPRRWLSFAVVVVFMAAIVSGVYAVYGSASAAESSLASWLPELRAGVSPPLELLSLKHQVEGGTFTVTGLVQNPPDGAAVHDAVAIVYLFDRDGNYFASGKAALEFDSLNPGDESAFVVRVPNTTRVSRYRVGFRSGADGVIAHVDRRGQAPTGTTGGSLEPAPREISLRGPEGRP